MALDSPLHSFYSLRQQRLTTATKEFRARGAALKRCETCLLGIDTCICNWIPRYHCDAEFILLLHNNEVYKPTNTGRLIGDCFPNNSHCFLWSRTQPDADLLQLLTRPGYTNYIVYPWENEKTNNQDTPDLKKDVVQSLTDDGTKPCFILLDGTWKQAGRMVKLSRWLDAYACLHFSEEGRNYAVRKSHLEHCLSTAEAAAICLRMAGEVKASEILIDYFTVFNQHYLATRRVKMPAQGESHKRLAELRN